MALFEIKIQMAFDSIYAPSWNGQRSLAHENRVLDAVEREIRRRIKPILDTNDSALLVVEAGQSFAVSVTCDGPGVTGGTLRDLVDTVCAAMNDGAALELTNALH
jgi:hypothetical protein